MKKLEAYAIFGFIAGCISLYSIRVPAIGLVMSVMAITFSLLGRKSAHKILFYSGLGMGTLGLVLSLIDQIAVLSGKA